MAKVGEGDPRWIVTEREDGSNVNSWHWTEKDVSEWAKKRIHDLLENSSIIDTPTVKCKTTTIGSYEGECHVLNRKGKVSFLLDTNFSCSWEGSILNDEGEELDSIKGKFVVPELDHDSNLDKLQVDVTSEKTHDALLDRLRKEGREFVRSRLRQFMSEVIKDHKVAEKKKESSGGYKTAAPAPVPAADLLTYEMELDWRAPPSELFAVLTDERRISAFTRGAAKFEKRVGGEFSILNGSIVGTVTDLEENKRLTMRWRMNNWKPDYYSTAELTFDSEEQGSCRMRLVHKGIPASDFERAKHGWTSNFWEPIKMLFGFGYNTIGKRDED